MIKILLFSCAMMILVWIYSLTAMASSATTDIAVKLKITHASCIVNDVKGISGVYNLPLINDSGRVVDRISYVDVPLIIDCTKGAAPEALRISFTAANPGFQDASNGLIKTTDADIGLQTRWKRNGEKIVDLSVATDILAIKDAEVKSGVFDSSLKVYPVILTPGGVSLTPGRYQADLSVNIIYY